LVGGEDVAPLLLLDRLLLGVLSPWRDSRGMRL
jgi:hypothetical protein